MLQSLINAQSLLGINYLNKVTVLVVMTDLRLALK